MGTVTVPPREAFAGVTRRMIEAHQEWDSMHEFVTLHWDGDSVDFGTLAVIVPTIHPSAYPDLMGNIVREAMDGERAATLYGYALKIEAHSMPAPGPDASADEQAQFQADRIGRRFHTRPEAVETVLAYAADIHGRVWGALKRRGTDGIEEVFYPPGERESHGQMVDALLAGAVITRTTVHGLPPMNPFGGRS